MTSRRVAIMGAALVALSIVAGITSSHLRAPRLCIDVVAQSWAKEKNATPQMYKQQQAEFLSLTAATDAELNDAWEKKQAQTYAKDHGGTDAASWIESFRKRTNCN